MSDNWKIRYCPKCGNIEILGLDEDCDYCETKLRDTEYFFDDVVERGDVKPEIQKAIFEKYIKNNPMYSEEDATKRKNTSNSSHIPSSYKTKQQNIPKCPTCGSTNVHPISSSKKAIGFLTVGVFSSNFGKTMHCKNCGYKW